MKLIAETAWHHEGDFLFMKKLVSDILTKTNADIIKLHITLDLNQYMEKDHKHYYKLKSMLFREDQWEELISIIKKKGKQILLLLNDPRAIKFGSFFKPEFIELHSVCLNVPLLKNEILKNFDQKTKIIIGVGGSTLEEINLATETFHNREIILMFGFQNYPTKYEDINLLKIKNIQSLHPNKIFGYADHTAWNNPNNEIITMMIAANGMSYIEKHVTNCYGRERTDFSAAISMNMFNSLSKKIKLFNQIKGNGSFDLNEGEKSYSEYGPMKMAAKVNSNLKVGHRISIDDIFFLRTKEKSDLSQIDTLNYLGKPLKKPIEKNRILNSSYFKNFK